MRCLGWAAGPRACTSSPGSRLSLVEVAKQPRRWTALTHRSQPSRVVKGSWFLQGKAASFSAVAGFQPLLFKGALLGSFLVGLPQQWSGGHGQCRGRFEVRAVQLEAEMEEEDVLEPFFVRLQKAWALLFPATAKRLKSGKMAKQRAILCVQADRAEVNEQEKTAMRQTIVDVLSSFVEIEKKEEVRVDVVVHPIHGFIYQVSVPVKRFKDRMDFFFDEYGNPLESMQKNISARVAVEADERLGSEMAPGGESGIS